MNQISIIRILSDLLRLPQVISKVVRKMFVKLVFLLCYFSGTYAQIRPSCRQIDFNYEASLDEFEPCEFLNVFGIKSYADVPFEPYRSNAENHLSNIHIGFSCFRTKQIFNLDIYTEIDSTIYLNSNSEDSESYVEILAFDTEEGDLHPVGTIVPSHEWNYFSVVFGRNSANAKVKQILDTFQFNFNLISALGS